MEGVEVEVSEWGPPIDTGHGSTRWEWEPAPGWFVFISTASSGEFDWANYIVTGPEELRIEGEAANVERAKIVVQKLYEALK